MDYTTLTDSDKKGDQVSHNGDTWISTIDTNTREPSAYGWEAL